MKKANRNLMRRSARVFLNELNANKSRIVREFLQLCRTVTQYFIDLFWANGDSGKGFTDLPTIHRAKDRFGITTRLGQALAKQAKETIAAVKELKSKRKPLVRRKTVTLFYHFATIEPFRGNGFDWAVNLIGSGAPRLMIGVKSTKVINQFLFDGWRIGKTIRLGEREQGLFVDFLMEKPRLPMKISGSIVGMDSNYKAGLVFSDGQIIGGEIYDRIQTFSKRQRNTHDEIKSLLGAAMKSLDLSNIRMVCVEDLKKVKHNKRGTFSRCLNRRMSHWLYRLCLQLLSRRCEESGVRLEYKDLWKTSQFCRLCGKWDKRNRKNDKFVCVHCGHSDNADRNAANNLEHLGILGAYGLR